MTSPANNFVWYQLMTTDTASAATFYKEVVGWTTQDMRGPNQDYTVFEAAGVGVGGMMTMPAGLRQAGMPPHWVGYVGVESVDDAAASIGSTGGAIHHPPEDIPEVGRFAVVADPQGAMFIVFQPVPGQKRPEIAPGTPGHIGWHELMAVNWETALDFYAGQFGWTKSTTHDMGPMGIYQLFAIGGQDAGGMFNKTPNMPAPAWLYYVNVPDIKAAAESVKQGGGSIVNGPHEVPGGSWILQCNDPQGGMFALVAPA